MLTLILFTAIFVGLFFRSLYGFIFSLIALFLVLYPVWTISFLFVAALGFYLIRRKHFNGHTKFNPSGRHDD